MRAPLSWLCDFAPFDQPVEELTDALSNLGLVVEGVNRVGGGLDGVVVARVLDIRDHPGADRICLVDVDAGDGRPLQIACGARNFSVGDLVPLAPVGAVLPGGLAIGRRKIRGEWSNGMLCSPSELELPAPGGTDGLLVLPEDLAAPGTAITEALELTTDVVFDLEISPNRPDALCMAGISRDLAAALHLPWAIPTGVPWRTAVGPAARTAPQDAARLEGYGDRDVGRAAAASAELRAAVSVADPELCPRFTATIIDGVEVRASPAGLARRLTLAGMRPINQVVDTSNYVMLDLGQPNHAYDLERLGGRGLVVRRGRPGERITTLDGVERAVGSDDCLICDAHSAPVGIGGIMGGASSEISGGTSTVLLEAAWFDPASVNRSGKRLGLHTEASLRFERGVDPEITLVAVDRFATLLGAGAGDRLRRGPTVDLRHDSLPTAPVVEVRTSRVNLVLATALSDTGVTQLLAPIGFSARAVGPGRHAVRIPSWRPDSTREIDVIEEVARLHGYRNIARRLPAGTRTGAGLTSYQRERRRVRDILAGAGLSEAWTTTFLALGDLQRAGLPAAAVEVENPLDRSESILRPALLPGLLKAVRFNTDHQQSDVRLFETGRCFALPGDGPLAGDPVAGGQAVPDEREDLAVIMSGPGVDARWAARTWRVLVDALRLADVTIRAASVPGLHPARGAEIVGDRAPIGALGEVDPDVVAAYGLSGRIAYLTVDLEVLVSQRRRPIEARLMSRYPASDIDLAFLVPDTVPAAAVETTLRATTGDDLLESVWLFDVYRDPQLGAGRRSMAFRLRFRATDRTLSDVDLAALREASIKAVTQAHGATLRA